MKTITQTDFIQMPWKNGGGITTEIFCLKSSNTNEILFRISEAQVAQDGPFSIFPNLDRILMLTYGDGFKLHFNDHLVTMDQALAPIYFSGQENVHCELINGECLDFNIMTNRKYGKSSLEIKVLDFEEKITSLASQTFLYLPEFKTLHSIDNKENFINQYKLDLLIYQINLNL